VPLLFAEAVLFAVDVAGPQGRIHSAVTVAAAVLFVVAETV